MACGVIVPKESEAMETCVITHWYVKKGDFVRAGDLVCGVETGKASFDLEALEEGTVLDIFFAEGAEAPLLVPVAVIGEQGEDYRELKPKNAHTDEKDRTRVPEASHPEIKSHDHEPQAFSPPTGTGRVPASPKARMYAKKRNIALESVKGTGPGGAVVMRDLLSTR